eukprot:gene33506-43298_t
MGCTLTCLPACLPACLPVADSSYELAEDIAMISLMEEWVGRSVPGRCLAATYTAPTHATTTILMNARLGGKQLDVVELTAVFACLPTEFEEDPDHKKGKWLSGVESVVRDMVRKRDAGKPYGATRSTRGSCRTDFLQGTDSKEGNPMLSTFF